MDPVEDPLKLAYQETMALCRSWASEDIEDPDDLDEIADRIQEAVYNDDLRSVYPLCRFMLQFELPPLYEAKFNAYLSDCKIYLASYKCHLSAGHYAQAQDYIEEAKIAIKAAATDMTNWPANRVLDDIRGEVEDWGQRIESLSLDIAKGINECKDAAYLPLPPTSLDGLGDEPAASKGSDEIMAWKLVTPTDTVVDEPVASTESEVKKIAPTPEELYLQQRKTRNQLKKVPSRYRMKAAVSAHQQEGGGGRKGSSGTLAFLAMRTKRDAGKEKEGAKEAED
ncbi:hypothetical protein LTR86_000853 [Recurvomyces mirabilis]|nr:hypothetical protein LTR86_000853 [Recurvomyces mirabilis]